jgi:hypothetical protein
MAVQSMLSLLVSAAKSATASGLKLLPPRVNWLDAEYKNRTVHGQPPVEFEE